LTLLWARLVTLNRFEFLHTLTTPPVEGIHNALIAFLQTSSSGVWTPDEEATNSPFLLNWYRGNWIRQEEGRWTPREADVDLSRQKVIRTWPMQLEVTIQPSPVDFKVALRHLVFGSPTPFNECESESLREPWRLFFRKEAEELSRYLQKAYVLDAAPVVEEVEVPALPFHGQNSVEGRGGDSSVFASMVFGFLAILTLLVVVAVNESSSPVRATNVPLQAERAAKDGSFTAWISAIDGGRRVIHAARPRTGSARLGEKYVAVVQIEVPETVESYPLSDLKAFGIDFGGKRQFLTYFVVDANRKVSLPTSPTIIPTAGVVQIVLDPTVDRAHFDKGLMLESRILGESVELLWPSDAWP
jgi:hypothetical protein